MNRFSNLPLILSLFASLSAIAAEPTPPSSALCGVKAVEDRIVITVDEAVMSSIPKENFQAVLYAVNEWAGACAPFACRVTNFEGDGYALYIDQTLIKTGKRIHQEFFRNTMKKLIATGACNFSKRTSAEREMRFED